MEEKKNKSILPVFMYLCVILGIGLLFFKVIASIIIFAIGVLLGIIYTIKYKKPSLGFILNIIGLVVLLAIFFSRVESTTDDILNNSVNMSDCAAMGGIWDNDECVDYMGNKITINK